MSAVDEVWHVWEAALAELCPGVRATRRRNWLRLALGIALAGSCAVGRAAGALPGEPASGERRLRRWLANAAVEPAALWGPVLAGLLARWAGREVVLVFDPTPYRERFTLLVVSVVWGERALPVAWAAAPQQEAWPEAMAPVLARLLGRVAAALPPGAGPVTVLLDRGLVGAAVVDAVTARGWHPVLRLKAGEREALVARRRGGGVGPLRQVAAAVAAPGRCGAGEGALFKGAGWRDGWLMVWWGPAHQEPLVLFSTRPGGMARVAESRRQVLVEATCQDLKSRGLGLEDGRLRSGPPLERLLLAVLLADWLDWVLGMRAVRQGAARGARPRTARWRIGLRQLRAALAGTAPLRAVLPFPVRPGPNGPRLRWVL